jgi:hypothetical protein
MDVVTLQRELGEALRMFGRKKVALSPPTNVARHPTRVLLTAAQYVGFVAPPGARVEELGPSMPCHRASSPPGRRFEVTTDKGKAMMFFFPDHAALWMNGEPQPRPQIPTEMIVDRISGYEAALAYALKGIPDD